MKAEENTKFTFKGTIPIDTITFNINNEVVMQLKPNGEIYVKGKLIENDIELVDGMRDLVNRNRIHQINKDLNYQKELNIKQKHIENLESQIIDLKIDLEHYKKVAQDMSKF